MLLLLPLPSLMSKYNMNHHNHPFLHLHPSVHHLLHHILHPQSHHHLHYLLHYVPNPYLCLINILCKPDPKVEFPNQSFATKLHLTTHTLNHLPIKLPFNTLNGVKPLMLSLKPCKNNKPGHLSLYLLI